MLQVSRYLALLFAIVLAVAEFMINQARPEWQYAPLWIIDYIIVLTLLGSFAMTRAGKHIGLLLSAWSLCGGVMYMAYFVSVEPDNLATIPMDDRGLIQLIGLALVVSVIGIVTAKLALLKQDGFASGA
ncbi:MAG: hypothetical protein AAF431_15240 [Pseudomonadota bacterium]